MNKNKEISINERIISIIDVLFRGNKSNFASEIGSSPQVIDNITGKRKSKPSWELIEKISSLKEINLDWLIRGNGEMLSAPTNIDDERLVAHRVNDEYCREGIPLIPIDAMAGAAAGEMQVLEYDCERYTVPGLKRADFLITVRGDSMMPAYNPGDVVACLRVPIKDIYFQWGRVYVLDTDQGALIKRIQPSNDSEHIDIHSDNPKYRPFSLPLSSLHSIALVIGLIRIE